MSASTWCEAPLLNNLDRNVDARGFALKVD